jgi:hypothetical protein
MGKGMTAGGCMSGHVPLERGLDTTVVTWMNASVWSAVKDGKIAGPLAGYGKLLATL